MAGIGKKVHHQLLEKLARYDMPQKARELLKEHKPLIIAGATASGKNSIVKHLESSGKWQHVITHTTRPPRSGEQNGKNYWFVSEDKMLELVNSASFIEANAVHQAAFYGTSIAVYEKVAKTGTKPILIIDVQGVKDLVKKVPELEAKFILPPSFEAWLERLDKRGTMSSVERHRRFASAKHEIEQALSERHFTFVVNKDVASAAKETISETRNSVLNKHNHELAQQLLEQIRQY